ncbi:DNA-processing protein DprA [Glaciecola siphonariae]|uniref:DNA-processing protein DprA n=1 Tax=Glaciecola siphonariae TaxID=521012 RepID=A0ABV9LQM4_9ALTE
MTTDSVLSASREDEISAYLRLDGIPKIGIASLLKTAKMHGCRLLDIPALSRSDLVTSGWQEQQIRYLCSADTSLRRSRSRLFNWLNKSDTHHFIGFNDFAYPSSLKHLTRPPLFLLVAGQIEALAFAQLAMIGTRSPSQYAKEVVDDLVSAIASNMDVALTSGMALGIDGLSHRASLHHGMPTLAVLGCGIDIAYPKRHQSLYYDIQESGAVISEFVPGTVPHASLFPRRNRIISGLAQGVIVVEAKIKSGTLVTAKYALEQNKEVFAVPSAIYNPNAEGCHHLIKQGAKLIENAQDILDELPFLAKNQEIVTNPQKSVNQDLASDPLLDSVGYSAISVDLIAKRTGMSVSDVLIQLLQYELRGIVASTPEGYVKLRG